MEKNKMDTVEVICDKIKSLISKEVDTVTGTASFGTLIKSFNILDPQFNHAFSAGIGAKFDDNGNLKPNNGRFSTERVENMSEEEYAKFCEQRKTANKIFHDKLNSDPVYREAHYSKIFKNKNFMLLYKIK